MYFQVFIHIQIYCCFSGSTTYKIYLHIYISHKLYSIYHGIFATILILPPIVILKVIKYPATPTKKPEYQLKLYVCLQVLISLRVKILFLFAHPNNHFKVIHSVISHSILKFRHIAKLMLTTQINKTRSDVAKLRYLGDLNNEIWTVYNSL